MSRRTSCTDEDMVEAVIRAFDDGLGNSLTDYEWGGYSPDVLERIGRRAVAAVLAAAPKVTDSDVYCEYCRSPSMRKVWSCDGVLAFRDDCENVDCPLEHRALLAGDVVTEQPLDASADQ